MKNNRRAVDERQKELLNIVISQGEISVEELAERLSVSEMTVRRDLALLSNRGLLVRRHGSAASNTNSEILTKYIPDVLESRDAISVFAASLVNDGDSIFINGSRTALNLLNHVGEKKVRVITNNGWALDGKYSENVQLRILGGYAYEHILVGEYAIESLIGLTADKLFVGCAAVYWDGIFRYDIPSEIGINEMMVSRTTGEIYVLADHSKLRDRDDAMVYGCFRYPVPVTLVTDEKADPNILRQLRSSGLQVLIVSMNGTLKEDISQ